MILESLLGQLDDLVVLAHCFDDGVDVPFVEDGKSLQLVLQHLDLFLRLTYLLYAFRDLFGLLDLLLAIDIASLSLRFCGNTILGVALLVENQVL